MSSLLAVDSTQPHWLELLHAWASRVGAVISWIITALDQGSNGTVWKAEVSINGYPVPGIVGMGNTKARAKADAVQQMHNRGDILTMPLNEPYSTPLP